MSAALKRVHIAPGAPIKKGEPFTLADGSLVIPPEKCAWFSASGTDAAQGRDQIRYMIEAEHDREVRFGPSAKPANVRIATPDDEQAILDLLLIDVEENARRIAVPDPERILTHVKLATRMKGGVCGVIDGPNGKPAAVTLLVPLQWWWSREWFYQEVVSFVDPAHRKSRYAHDLIAFQRHVGDKASEGYGHRMYVLMGILGIKRVREKAIMVRRKMRQVGMAFLYPCPYGDDERMT